LTRSRTTTTSLKRANAEAAIRAGVKFIEGDLNVVDLNCMLDGVDVIFHYAGQPGVRSSWGSDFSTYTYCNIEATQRLLEASRGSRTLQRLVFASSSSVYGNAERYPTSENDRPQPISPYGVTKLAAEHLCSLYATTFGRESSASSRSRNPEDGSSGTEGRADQSTPGGAAHNSTTVATTERPRFNRKARRSASRGRRRA
jgi:nucleoside-diphosphate-sugar epimerase